MPAYFVIHNRVTDDEAMQSYIPPAVGSIMAHGGEVMVLDESSTLLEGSCEFPRTIIIKFESREKAEAWYACEEYQAVLPVRLGATEGFGFVVDGFEMPS